MKTRVSHVCAHRRLVTASSVVLALSGGRLEPGLDDWPQWRGPNRDGRSAETGLLKTWPPGGPPLAWQATGAGRGLLLVRRAAVGRYHARRARRSRYVIAFDAATGKELWATAHGRRFGNDRGDGPRGTPTVEGDRVYAFGASGDLSVLEAATGESSVDGERSAEIRRLQHHVGAQRIAARPRRSYPRQRWRTGVVHRRAEQEGRLADLEEPERPGRVLLRRCCTRSASVRQAIFFTDQRALGVDVANGRLLWSYDQSRERHRQHRHADRPRQPRVPVVGLRHGRGAARAEARANGSARESLFHARDAQPPRELGARRRLSLRVLERHPDGHALRQRPGRLEGSQRRQGLARVRRRPPVSVQRRTAWWAWPRRRPTAYREHGRFQIKTGSLPTWATPSCQAASCSCGIRTRSTRTTSGGNRRLACTIDRSEDTDIDGPILIRGQSCKKQDLTPIHCSV